MKTFSRLWQYLVEFSFKIKIFQTKTVEKIKTHILYSGTFFLNRAVYENFEKCCGPRKAIWRLVACWISKATRAHAHASARPPTLTLSHTHVHTHTENM